MRKEIHKRQRIELGGHPVNTVAKSKKPKKPKALSLFLTAFTQPKQKGRTQDSHDTKSKQA